MGVMRSHALKLLVLGPNNCILSLYQSLCHFEQKWPLVSLFCPLICSSQMAFWTWSLWGSAHSYLCYHCWQNWRVEIMSNHHMSRTLRWVIKILKRDLVFIIFSSWPFSRCYKMSESSIIAYFAERMVSKKYIQFFLFFIFLFSLLTAPSISCNEL